MASTNDDLQHYIGQNVHAVKAELESKGNQRFKSYLNNKIQSDIHIP